MRKPAKSIKICAGCRDDFYNGKNPYGIKRCWNFPSAQIVKRIKVSVNERPPYDAKRAVWTFSCHNPQGCVQVPLEALTKEGFWKS